jgi:hypothetical protein
VTVEASSPALIEKTRNVVTSDNGQYQVVNLLSGTFTVTFTLTGFATVKREGIVLSGGTFVATVNADMSVGSVQETVTVVSESPVVDIQNSVQQTTMTKDLLAAIPAARQFSARRSWCRSVTDQHAERPRCRRDRRRAAGGGADPRQLDERFPSERRRDFRWHRRRRLTMWMPNPANPKRCRSLSRAAWANPRPPALS